MGQRAVGKHILKIITATTPSKVYTQLEQVQMGLTMGGSVATWDNNSLDNTTWFTLTGAGDKDYTISGSYLMAENSPAQEALEAALDSTSKEIEVQWAERKGTGEKLYTAVCVVTEGTTTFNDPLTRSFTLKPKEAPTETTQA